MRAAPRSRPAGSDTRAKAWVNHHITSDTLLTFGVIAIAVGALVILLAMSLARGSNIVRWAFVVLSALNAAGGLYAVVEYEGAQRMSGAYTLGFSLLILWILLGNKRVEDSFEA